MNYKLLSLEVFALVVSYLVLMLPVTSATQISIIFNGVVQETLEYDQSKVINKQITIKHDPYDITWTDVKVLINLNSASLAHSIQKIYLYKCRKLSPAECVYSDPQVFDKWIDTELAWRDISEREGTSQYPQVANLMFIIKTEDVSGKTGWIGFWNQIRRDNYNVFNTYEDQIDGLDFYASSLDLVQPIKNYIQNKLMLPVNWATKIVLREAGKVYALGASESEIEQHEFQTAVSADNEIESINKDYYFVLPETTNGIADPVTLNLNPSFTCGDSVCESDLGENPDTCCYDCGCPDGYYCDVNASLPSSGECKSEGETSIEIVSVGSPQITDCSEQFPVDISFRVTNPPSSIEPALTTVIKLGEDSFQTSCEGSGGVYSCQIHLAPGVSCGAGTYQISPGTINTTITYNDGVNSKSMSLGLGFSGVTVNYDCTCGEGEYCDTGTEKCESEDAITLGITKLTSYLDQYQPGDRIHLTAKIFNPPTGMKKISESAELNLTEGHVTPGTPECSEPSSDNEYECSIPFQIADFDPEKGYTFDPNTLTFVITYNDGDKAKTKTLSAPFGPVSIPARYCGDGTCDVDESSETCCLDCGCGSGEYCDKVSGCRQLDSIKLSVSPPEPGVFYDCRESHLAEIMVTVENAPTDMRLDSYTYTRGGSASGWNLQCEESALSNYKCQLSIPKLEPDCELPYYTVGPNRLEFSISFSDGKSTQTATLSGDFDDILVVPVYHCGDMVCESDLNENAGNCCVDCPCEDDSGFGPGYFCDYHSEYNPNGTCTERSGICLLYTSPSPRD